MITRTLLGMLLAALRLPAGLAAQSVHSFFREDDLVFKPELLGEWKVSGETVELRDLGDKTYGAVWRFDQSAVLFRLHLFQIGQKYFMDLQVVGIKESRSTCANAGDGAPAIIPIADGDFDLESEQALFINHQHLLLRVALSTDKNQFAISFLREDWVRTQEQTGRLNFAHTNDDDDTKLSLFVAESDDLRAWVRELPDEAFDNPDTMQRADSNANAEAAVPVTSP